MYGCGTLNKFSDDKCNDGKVLLPERRCDGFIECVDGSDEGEQCLEAYGCCTGNSLKTFKNKIRS